MVEGLNTQCPKCGMNLPTHASKCLFCMCDLHDTTTEDESVDEILEDLTSLLTSDTKEAREEGLYHQRDDEELLAGEDQEEKRRMPVRVKKKIVAEKVREGPPNR